MNDSPSLRTSVSLLGRIRKDEKDPQAWREFVDRYGRHIYAWCLNRRLQPADAEDVTQQVLVKLAQRLGTFEYDRNQTFRGWLRRITENAVTDFFRESRARKGTERTIDGLEELDRLEAREDLTTRLGDAFDLELLDVAKARVRLRVEPRRWRAWELTAVEQVKGEAVAEQLDMKLPTVYSSRYQVQKMIADEVKELEAESRDLLESREDVNDHR